MKECIIRYDGVIPILFSIPSILASQRVATLESIMEDQGSKHVLAYTT